MPMAHSHAKTWKAHLAGVRLEWEQVMALWVVKTSLYCDCRTRQMFPIILTIETNWKAGFCRQHQELSACCVHIYGHEAEATIKLEVGMIFLWISNNGHYVQVYHTVASDLLYLFVVQCTFAHYTLTAFRSSDATNLLYKQNKF